MKAKHSKYHDKYIEFQRINKAIAANDHKEIGRIYKQYVSSFCTFIKKRYRFLEQDELMSIYNDSLQFVFTQSTMGKLRFYQAEFKTYLMAIGLKKSLSYIGKYRREYHVVVETFEESLHDVREPGPEIDIHAIDFQYIMKIVEQMKAPCDIILSLTYKGVGLDDIAALLNRTRNAIKTKRSACLKQIRVMLDKKNIKGEDVYGG